MNDSRISFNSFDNGSEGVPTPNRSLFINIKGWLKLSSTLLINSEPSKLIPALKRSSCNKVSAAVAPPNEYPRKPILSKSSFPLKSPAPELISSNSSNTNCASFARTPTLSLATSRNSVSFWTLNTGD